MGLSFLLGKKAERVTILSRKKRIHRGRCLTKQNSVSISALLLDMFQECS